MQNINAKFEKYFPSNKKANLNIILPPDILKCYKWYDLEWNQKKNNS